MRSAWHLAGLLVCLWSTVVVAQPSSAESGEVKSTDADPSALVIKAMPEAPTAPAATAPSEVQATPAEADADKAATISAPTVAEAAREPATTHGIASWYGRQFHGRKTASGERFNMYGLTAAHKTLPLMSYVRVRNPSNGKSIVVRITDRGPFVANRMIDLSYGAAQELGIHGLGAVEMDAVDRAEYEAQGEQSGIARDLREASFLPVPARRTARRPLSKAKPDRR